MRFTPRLRPEGSNVTVFMHRCNEHDKMLGAVKKALEGDEDLDKYHRLHASALQNNRQGKEVRRHTIIYNEIKKNSRFLTYSEAGWHYYRRAHMYRVYIKEVGKTPEIIGYTVLYQTPLPLLYSFGISPKYRNKDVLMQWLDCISEKFSYKPYSVVLDMQNTRAIRFFERNGFKQVKANKKTKIVALHSPQEEAVTA